jgi:signal transduction histidine kinase
MFAPGFRRAAQRWRHRHRKGHGEGMVAVSGEVSALSAGVTPAVLWAEASHDLRQPIQALLLLTRTLSGGADEAAMRRTVEHMDRALHGLHGKLELLTELSRLEAGRKATELRPCCLAELHDRIMREMEAIAEQHGIGLRSRSPRGVVRSDAKLLGMVLKSLIMNAIRFGLGDDILVGWRQRGGHVQLELYFKAPPISPAQAQSALIELYDRRNRRPTGELGLGLGFVSHLCSWLGHRIDYTPLPASGHRFALSLPLMDEASASRSVSIR